MTPLHLVLPWPVKGLSPNARGHWAKTARDKRRYREACAWAAKSQGAGKLGASRLHVHCVFVPPDRRKRDDQNCMASMKAGLDGLADVLGVDDSKWRTSYEMAPDGEIGGMVRVIVQEAHT